MISPDTIRGVVAVDLARFFNHFACLLALGLLPIGALADAGDDPKMQVLFIGVDPAANTPGDLPPDLPVIAIDTLPAEEAAKQAIFAARLRASPVSTFVAEPNEANAQFEQFFLVASAGLKRDDTGYQLTLGDEQFALDAFASRISAVVSAFNPQNRRIGFLRIADPEDAFPMAISEIQIALDSIGFDLMVVMIGGDAPTTGCEDSRTQALHYSLISGLADRAPFGDGNGISTSAEVESYLGRALNRQVKRDPICGPRYSLLIKSSNDPAAELISYKGRSPFTQMETQLYNETFEAMFLMQSEQREAVDEFLTSCLYCPNERALTERLRDMQEFARASSLEGDIWNRIKDDTAPDRLAIYLDNCTLCSFKDEVEDKIAEIDAKTRAAGAEKVTFDTAVAQTDLDTLKTYASDCIACAYSAEAEAEISRIEADVAYQAEQTTLATALENRDPDLLQAYLEDCAVCSGQDDVAAALVRESKRLEFSQPCLEMAAVPQLGGPRKLEDIDQSRALATCEAAAREFPSDGLIRTTLGRIAQAGGDFEAAKASYAFGMEDETPSAYGLAAYSHYAPPQGEEIDLIAAEVLAAKGAVMGDWLSQEILTVLYSKDLIPGKTPEDAFLIAQNIADEGNPLAQFFVGYYHLTGTGTEQSDEDAAKWLAMAVGQGYTHAYSFLAELHEKGAGPDASIEKAADLYWDALQKGDPTAAERLTTQIRDRDREVVRIIQQKLQDEGAYRGSVDGIAGQGTVAAIRRYAEELVEQG